MDLKQKEYSEAKFTEERLEETHADLSVECRESEELPGDEFCVDFFVSIGKSIANPLYSFSLLARATFEYDPSEFDKSKVAVWARQNGFYLLLPFIRQMVFDLTKYSKPGAYYVPMLTNPHWNKPLD